MFDDLLSIKHYERRGKTLSNFGMDSESECFDIDWYKSFSKDISYVINQNGFRDVEHNNFQNQFFAIGDSFTFGLGQPYTETWPVQLESLLSSPIIKLACDGVSNDWIRVVFNRIIEFNPQAIFIMLSFAHREFRINNGFIEHLHFNEEDIKNLTWAENMIERTRKNLIEISDTCKRLNVPVFFTAIPQFDSISYSEEIRNMLIPYHRLFSSAPIKIYQKFSDLARDGFHFGEKTSKEVAANFYKSYKQKVENHA